MVNVYNSLARAARSVHTKQGDKEADRYYQMAKAIELNTDSKDLPEFAIRNTFAWLSAALSQHTDIYEGELNTKAKEETEWALR